MDIITNFYRRACDESDPNSDACAKPTSTVLEDAVPAAVVGVLVGSRNVLRSSHRAKLLQISHSYRCEHLYSRPTKTTTVPGGGSEGKGIV
jgi:hypothetical protein